MDYSLPRTRLAYLQRQARLSLESAWAQDAYDMFAQLRGNFQLKAGAWKNPSRVCAWAQLLRNAFTRLLNLCDCVSCAKSNNWRSLRNRSQVAQDAHGRRRVSQSFPRVHNTALYSPPSSPGSHCLRVGLFRNIAPTISKALSWWFMLHGDILLVWWVPCEPKAFCTAR